MNQALQIIKGTIFYFFSRNKELSKKRMLFCNNCPLKGKYLGVIDKCNECGCILNFKTRVGDTTCPIEKW